MRGKRKHPRREALEQKNKEKHLLVTMTGEPYQLARIHYEVFDRGEIARIFSRLECMDYDPDHERWVWLYHGEAKKLKFNWSYSSIPEENHPIAIGSFFSRSEHEMFLNVNSFDRATKGIAFFDRYFRRGLIKKALAKVTDIEVVNKFFEPSAGGVPKHEDYFDKRPVSKTDPEAVVKKLAKIASSVEDKAEGAMLAFSYLEESAKQPFPEIERLPTHFYEDGIKGIEAGLRSRQAVTLQHWRGNTKYTYYDLVQDMLHGPTSAASHETGDPDE